MPESPSVRPDPGVGWPVGRWALIRARLGTWRSWFGTAAGLRVFLLYLPGPGPILMSWLRRRWLCLRNPHVEFDFRGPVYLGPGFSLHAPHGGRLVVGPGVEFRRRFRAEMAGPEATIEIGEMSTFTYDVVIQCSTLISIGRFCTFGQATLLADGHHRFFDDHERPPTAQGYDFRPLQIADYVTVTSKATVTADIGTRTVVAAHAVVNTPMPPFCVVGGVPARVLRWHGPPGSEPPAELAPLPAVKPALG